MLWKGANGLLAAVFSALFRAFVWSSILFAALVSCTSGKSPNLILDNDSSREPDVLSDCESSWDSEEGNELPDLDIAVELADSSSRDLDALSSKDDIELTDVLDPDVRPMDLQDLGVDLPDLDVLLVDVVDGFDEDLEEDVAWEDVWVDIESDVPPELPGSCLDRNPAPWSRKLSGAGGALTFNELMVNPGPASSPLFIEFYNPFSIDMDVSGWQLKGNVSFRFPDDTFVPPGGYLVIASDPSMLSQPDGVPVLGPWNGMFPPLKASVELVNNTDRLMDSVEWSAADPWPVAVAGSGASLAKVRPLDRSDSAESWRASRSLGGTPGSANFPPCEDESVDPADDEDSEDEDCQLASLRFTEMSGASQGFWVELTNIAASSSSLAGIVIASSTGQELALSGGTLQSQQRAVLTQTELGFSPAPGDLLFLYSAGKSQLLDAVQVRRDPRARVAPEGRWYYPAATTQGSANALPPSSTVVINEIMYHHAPLQTPYGSVSSTEEWVELHNWGDETVDVGGWALVDAVEYQFPEGFLLAPGAFVVVAKDAEGMGAEFSGVNLVGDFKGKLDNSGERLALLDACGNLMDDVRYADGPPWPAWADAGGSSLELRDPLADNSSPEAWADSEEFHGSAWESVVIEDILAPSLVGPDGQWEELVLGLLDDGEVLIDDLSLVEDPEGAALELLQNGSFEEAGVEGWRLLGNHRHSEVIDDPTSTGNHVLRLVATGATEHMHNHAETTLSNGASFQNGVLYRLTFRARWVAGSNQLNSRLYFNRMARTTLLSLPVLSGTPGAPNSQLLSNLGPTYAGLRHSPVVPEPFQPVEVSVSATDPDGVQSLILWYAVDSGPAQSIDMAANGSRFVASIPGAEAGSVTQFWIEGFDQLSASSTYPRSGAASRALFKVSEEMTPPPMHTLRIILTPQDDAWMFTPHNLMSNDYLGATVVWDETEVFYDVGVRIKGSERGRPTGVRVGFAIHFPRDHLFRGVYRSAMVDRSEGVNFGQREMLINLMMARAGSVSAEYNDLIHLYSPHDAYSGSAELQLARFGDQLLAYQFDSGEDGQLYEYELIYFPTTTVDGNPESPKLPQPDTVVGTEIRGLGDDKEDYRYVFTLKNNRREDAFAYLMEFATAFGEAGNDFTSSMPFYMDIDQWLRAFAFSILADPVDNYGTGSAHNAQFYVRPDDHRVLFFPHDLDFYGSNPQNAVASSPDLQRIISNPVYARLFYGHLVDILEQSYNTSYMSHWCDQLGSLLPEQNFPGHLQFITARASWVYAGSPNSVVQAFPEVPFEITSNGGEPFETGGTLVSITGRGWVNVRSIRRAGATLDLPVTWMDGTQWSTVAALTCGPNLVELEARNHQGVIVATDSVVITRTGGPCP